MKAKKLLTLALGAALAVSLTVPAMAAEKTFSDVPGTWAEDSITRWADAGVLEGDNTGEYKPGKSMTRAEFAAMLCKLMGYTEMAENIYGDVSPTAWYHDAILKVTAAGVMKGDGKNANPDAPVSREEAAVMLCRAMNLKGEGKTVTKFDDSAAVASWAQEAVAALTERGMINGVGGNMFAPADSIDRASAAHLLDNMVHTYITAPGEYTVDDPDAIVIVNAKAVESAEGEAAQAVTVTGQADTVVVAPGTDAAVTGEKLAAANVTVQAETPVTVDKDSKVADVTVSAAAEVTVAGEAANVTVAAPAAVTVSGKADSVTMEGGALTVADGGKVDAVAVPETAADDVALTVDKGANVGNLTADSPVAVENNGTVAKVEANADGVTIDGNAPQKIDTAEGVTAPTDSKGETVTEKPAPSSGGSSSSGSSGGSSGGSDTPVDPTPEPTKYTVTIGTAQNGKVTVDKNEAAENDTVTITATPNEGYVVKTVKVTKTDSSEVTVENNKTFKMPASNVTVTVTFEAPIKGITAFIVNSNTEYAKLPKEFKKIDSGTNNENFGGWGNHEAFPWLAIVPEYNNGDTTTVLDVANLTVTFEGTKKTTPWSGAAKHYSALTAYVNEEPSYDPLHDNADQFKIADDYGTFKVTWVVGGATYEASCSYAKQGVTVYTVTFDSKGGSKVDPITVKGGPITKPTDPTKDGYTFGGWAATDGGTAVDLTQETINSDKTYYAIWTANTYNITYNANGGTVDSSAPTTFTAAAAATLPTATKAGYTLDGWYLDSGFSNKVTALGAGNIPTSGETVNVYAKWTATEYTIKYMDGSEAMQDLTPAAFTVETAATLPIPTDKEGHKFGGWYKEAALTNQVTALGGKAEDIPASGTEVTVYAKWVANTYTVTFEGADGVEAQKVQYNQKATKPANDPTKEGYKFLGWFKGDATTKFSFDTEITEDTTLTAKWSKLSTVKAAVMSADDYTLVMNALFGENSYPEQSKMAAITAVEGDKLIVTSPANSELAYVENFTAFNGDNDAEQKGYYVLVTFHIDEPTGVTVEDETVIATLCGGSQKTFTYKTIKGDGATWDGNFAVVYRIGDDAPDGNVEPVEFITIDLDGDGTVYEAVTFKLNYSRLTFAAKPTTDTGDTAETPAETPTER